MKIMLIAPPILKDQHDATSYLTLPPIGYGGVENVMYALIQGLLHFKHEITVLGAPGSRSMNGVEIIRDARTPSEIRQWVLKNAKGFDCIHDHACGLVFNTEHLADIKDLPYLATHHQTGRSPYPRNTVYLSYAQRAQAGDLLAPIIRIPVMSNDYLFAEKKEEYFLYLGRLSEWKGVYEAAALCKALNKKLVVAGPAWEIDYFNKIKADYSETIEYVGSVSGLKRLEMLAKAKGVFVLSRFSQGPWGDHWCEPGSTVVSEACASGTTVISSTNGCLAELVVPEVGFQLTEKEISDLDISKIKGAFPEPAKVRAYAEKNWGYLLITQEYINLYGKYENK